MVGKGVLCHNFFAWLYCPNKLLLRLMVLFSELPFFSNLFAFNRIINSLQLCKEQFELQVSRIYFLLLDSATGFLQFHFIPLLDFPS